MCNDGQIGVYTLSYFLFQFNLELSIVVFLILHISVIITQYIY